ncbi:MAG TPA: hypothetical protein VFN30_04165 [Chitinophagaceae bacterium]|nr:hypothetical protein [Chitinophagaceae bacterium]
MIYETCVDTNLAQETEKKKLSLKSLAEELYLHKKNAAYVEHSSYWYHSNLHVINMQEDEDAAVRTDVTN